MVLFESMFAIMPVLFILVVVFIIGKVITQSVADNESPVLAVEARVADKLKKTDHHDVATGAVTVHPQTNYYASFRVESGDVLEFHISGREYQRLQQGAAGKLQFQGSRYLHFAPLEEAVGTSTDGA